LISVGMLVDISVVLDGPRTLIVAVALTLVALTGKWLAALATQKHSTIRIHRERLSLG